MEPKKNPDIKPEDSAAQIPSAAPCYIAPVQVSCCFCGQHFTPWEDKYGDMNDNACGPCDISYEEGQFNDRDLGCS